jgi:hypothetical protein
LGLWEISIDETLEPEMVATACVIIAMQYANNLEMSIQDNIAKVIRLIK